MRSQRSASSGWWVVTMMLVLALAAQGAELVPDPAQRSGSTPRPGSSSSRSSGSCSSTRAISMRRRMPPE